MDRKGDQSLDVARITLQVLCIGAIILAVSWILLPFLTAILWAATIVITTWPVLLWVQTRMKGVRGFAVAVMTLMLLLVVILPFLGAVVVIIEKAGDVAEWVQSLAAFSVPPPPQWLERIPVAGPKLVERWRQFQSLGTEELTSQLAPYLKQVAGWLVDKSGSVLMLVVQFLLTVIIAAVMYTTGETAAAGIRRFARRLAGQQGEDATILAAKAVRGVALGVVVTAILQATVGGIGLTIVGFPAASLLTAVMFMLCLAQLGPALVLIPAVIWVYWQDGALWGTILLVFSLAAGLMDNFIRPVLIKKGADLPLLLIFAGVIGGLIAFGIIGLFIGPVLLAVAYTLMKSWVAVDDIQAGPIVAKEDPDG